MDRPLSKEDQADSIRIYKEYLMIAVGMTEEQAEVECKWALVEEQSDD